jgi:hypothetical protein
MRNTSLFVCLFVLKTWSVDQRTFHRSVHPATRSGSDLSADLDRNTIPIPPTHSSRIPIKAKPTIAATLNSVDPVDSSDVIAGLSVVRLPVVALPVVGSGPHSLGHGANITAVLKSTEVVFSKSSGLQLAGASALHQMGRPPACTPTK